MPEYREDEYVTLSEIQHFAYCPRQWAIVHLEQQWKENVLTIEGHALHDKAHDPTLKEKRRAKIISRGMPVVSHALGMRGECDVVEFIADSKGVFLPAYQGTYRVAPVEYKRGKPKEGQEDVLQLTAQAMCLAEMLAAEVSFGYLYYHEIRRRERVVLTEETRARVREIVQYIRTFRSSGCTPNVKKRRGCGKCSVADMCIPKLGRRESAAAYMERRLSE